MLLRTIMLTSALAALCAGAAEYSLDLTDATPLAAEAPVLRRAEKTVAVGQVPSVTVGDRLLLSLFDDTAFALEVVNEAPGFGGTRTFLAHLAGGASGVATIICGEGFAIVEVRDTASSRLCSVSIRDGKAYVEEVDLTRTEPSHCLVPDAPDSDDEAEAHGKSAKQVRLKSAAAGQAISTDIVARAPVTVDVMMVFDQGAQEWVASSQKYSSITNFAIAQVAKVNGVLVNTGLHTNYWLRLVDVVAVNARQTAITGDPNLNPMKNAVVGGEEPWDIVATRREASGADLVNLMINTGSRYGNTGYGDITTGANGDAWASKVNASFTCTSIHAVEVDYTLAHEVGHNMGLGHSDKQKSPGSSGAFTYSRGYYFTANDRKYHTIMAYSQDGYGNNFTETPYYSSPDYTYIENGVDTGVPVGLADKNDCTRALRQTCAYIAMRKATKIPFASDVVFSPDADTARTITLASPGGYDIHYTVDGSEPTVDSPLYSRPFTLVDGMLTIKAVTVENGNALGAIAERTYTAAVELDEYVRLANAADWGWDSAEWRNQYNNEVHIYPWDTGACSNMTALVDCGGSVDVNTKVSISNLVVDGTLPMTVNTSGYALFAKNIHALGDTTLTGTNYSFDSWHLHPSSSLTLAPGEGETFTYTNNLSCSDSTATLVFSNGTVNVTAPDSAVGCFGNAALRVANGGMLVIGGNGWKTGYGNTSPLTIDKGGTMRIDVIECIRRPLTLAGGTIEVNAYNSFDRALELRNTTVTVTEDSTIKATNPNGNLMTHTSNFTFDVRRGKTLTIEPKLVSNGSLGLVKTGYGTLRLEKAPGYTGSTSISKGTLAVDYSSTAATGTGWTVAKGATLKINEGRQLTLPSLTLKRGAELSLPAASAAPLAVNSSVSLYDVVISLNGAENLTLGARYPLVTSTGTISSVPFASAESMPELAEGLAWVFETEGDVLYARIANEADCKRDVPFICNNQSFVLKVPYDSTQDEDYGVKIASTPLAVDDILTESITFSMQFQVPEGGFGENGITLCGWNSGEKIIRCIVNSDGKIDCNFANNSHTSYVTLSPVLESGVHTIDIAYSSVTNIGTHGTHVMLDGELVYDDAELVNPGDGHPVTRVVFGGDVTLGSVGTGLDIKACGIVDPTVTTALPRMTISGGSVAYNYLTPKFATVYPMLPYGGYKMDSSAIDATYGESYDAVSISVVADFPADKKGSIIAMGMGSWVATQAEYEGDGTFALRYDGWGLDKNPARRINDANANVSSPHLYTLTYEKNGNLCFYQDGIEILRQDTLYKNQSLTVSYKFTFGAGCWHPWQKSGDFESNPMPKFKVYASHIALGTDVRTVSESAVIESLDGDPSYNSPILNISRGETVNLADVPLYVAAITGEGTLGCGATLPAKGYGLTQPEWKGVVAFEGLAADDATKDFRFELYGNAGSRIKLTNCAISYLKNNNATFSGTLVLDGDGANPAFKTTNGYSDWFNVFGELSGSGSMTFIDKPTQAYVFNTATNYLGGITVGANDYYGEKRGRKVVFGNVSSADDLPVQSATITVMPGAVAAIGANTTWNAYHGVNVVGTLLVKGANSIFECDNSASMGLVLADGAALRFDAADAKLAFGKNLLFASGTVEVAFTDGVTPADGAALVAWPSTSTVNGRFKLVGTSTNDYEIVTNATGLVFKKKPNDRLDLSGYTYLVENNVSAWLADNTDYYDWEYEMFFWQDYMQEKAGLYNGYTYLQNFLLGYDANGYKQKFTASVSFDADGNVVITTTEGTVPAVRGLGLVKKLYTRGSLLDPWTVKTLPLNPGEKSATVEKSGEAGFYKVEITVE